METVENLRDRARDCSLKGAYKLAIQYYSTGLDTHKDIMLKDPSIHTLFLTNRAICHNKIENWHYAISDCNQAFNISGITDKKRISKIHYTRAVAYKELNEIMRAQLDLQECLRFYPQNEQAIELSKQILRSNNRPSYSTEKIISLSEAANNEKLLCAEFEIFKKSLEANKSIIFNSDYIKAIKTMDGVTEIKKFREGFCVFLSSLFPHQKNADDKQLEFTNKLQNILGSIINKKKMADEIIENLNSTNSEAANFAIINLFQYLCEIDEEYVMKVMCESFKSKSSSLRNVSLICLSKLLNKKLMDKNYKPFEDTPLLNQIMENLIESLAKDDSEPIEIFCLSLIFRFLEDPHNESDKTNLEDIAGVLIGRNLNKKKSTVPNLLKGLNSLKALYLANRLAFRNYTSKNSIMPLLYDLMFLKNPENIQVKTAELLGKCMEFVELRESIRSNEINYMLNNLDNFPNIVKIQVASILARLCTQNSDIRYEILQKVHFISLIGNIFNCIEFTHIPIEFLEPAIQIFNFLSIHSSWKRRLTEHKSGELFDAILNLGRMAMAKNNALTYLFLNAMYFLICTRDDETTHTYQRKKAQFNFDDEQFKQLDELMKSLPTEAQQKNDFNYNLGDLKICEPIRKALIQAKFVYTLFRYIQSNPNLSEITYSSISSIVRLLGLKPEMRGLITKQGGLTLLLECVSKLKAKEDLTETRQAIAHLSMSMEPSLLSYKEVHSVISNMIILIQDSYELYQYEAALALIQSTVISDEVRERVWNLKGWDYFRSLVFTDHDLIRTAGLEGWCNLSCCSSAFNFFFENSKKFENFDDVKILFSFLLEDRNIASQRAAAGTIATLISYTDLFKPFYLFSKFKNVQGCWETCDDQPLIDRLFSILNTVLTSSEVKESEKAPIRVLLRKKMSQVSKTQLKMADPSLNIN